jgi:type IV fimbrial biogenesis protein FimT
MVNALLILRSRRAARSHGFTLIELMITLTVLAVFITLAAPSMRDLVIASQVRTAASDLYESVILARSEAIKRAANVDVIPASGNWQNGWTVQAGATVLQSRDAAPNVTIAPKRSNLATPTSTNITFTLDGRQSTDIANVIFSTTQSAQPIESRCVLIAASGRPSIRTDTDNDPSNGCN